MTPHAVIAVRFQTPDLFALRLSREGLTFTPGDCVALFNPQGISRPYSIASGTADDHLDILVRRIAGGELSTWLAARQPGDRIEVSQPFGWFRPGPGIFIATGVGLAPFLCYLRSTAPTQVARALPALSPVEGRARAAPPPRRPVLLYGLRHLADAMEPDFLRAHTDLRLAVSRESAPGTHCGRVTDLLDALPLNAEAQFYLCGLDTMVRNVTDWLRARGVPFANIHREIYFHANS